jgi:hypothetical protein
MAALKIFGSVWLLLFATALTLAVVQDTHTQAPPVPTPRSAVVTDLGKSELLQSDMRMLDQMRTAESPWKGPMIAGGAMWLDPVTIRAHEQYQAQFDRMLARR